ncbi:MAG: hypothetical protein A3B38_04495 [Candidatus Levybacteria bacterium RIFCSPLOWO2_01_FULL_36_13]|nr:MAG: hypothetical protein A2684_00245 [Candidatus Levybacteria bacterium RIFCSPHIGHO2_01_FULL_36_15b]OGH34088.1 MAG: hypothetical protein A3B38_04495 [Candidatus Levybacteria bacterium RIFCSPLOWO2_01_FULL_36_13]
MPDQQEEQVSQGDHSAEAAKRWLRIKGVGESAPEKNIISKVKEKVAPTDITDLKQEAYDLFAEKEELKADVVRKLVREMGTPLTPNSSSLNERKVRREDLAAKVKKELAEGSKEGQQEASLDSKKELIKQGRIDSLLVSDGENTSFAQVNAERQKRLVEIDNRIGELFKTPGLYDAVLLELGHETRVRKDAREVRKLDKFVDQIDLIRTKLAREAQISGRGLTSAENKFIQENEELVKDVDERKKVLLSDAEVFRKARTMELMEYKRQLHRDHFAETPSRKRYLRQIQQAWAEGRRVLATGETGTGKTELLKHASRALFGVTPEYVTGHQDLSIYELLGKTGFKVQVGDEFRPAPMIRAMNGRDGKGLPFLFDEIDRAPNQAVMGIKTLLNVRPGEKGIKIQTDSGGEINAGPDYAVSATANIKSSKYTTATDLDPAIVRVFDAPIDVDYIPPHEVYDLSLAQLMDRRGNIPLTREESGTVLKNLCDAADWIQRAYQGKKVVVSGAGTSEQILKARAGATRGETASLKKAILDPGRMLEMLAGWQAAKAKGVGFREYVGDKAMEFINNRAYPEEDRYYLVEIFALKGFLKGRKAEEFNVSDLNQTTLNSWNGGSS